MAINNNLPEVCYAYLEGENQIVGLLLGRPGYRLPSNLPDALVSDPAPVEAMAWVERQNAKLGVTPAQREAMLAGSLFGWHLPIADPDNFPEARAYPSQ